MLYLKINLSSLDITVIVKELNTLIKGSIVSNIYNVKDDLYIFKIHTLKGRMDLVIEPPRRIHLTKYSYPHPPKPSSFCTTLRRFLKQSRIVNIHQVEMERIVEFSLKRRKEAYRLIVELFREGNLILTDEKGVILRALRYKQMRDRTIAKGILYSYPPRNVINPLKASPDKVLYLFKNAKGDLVRNLITKLGIPPKIAEEVCYLSGLPKNKPIKEVDIDDVCMVLNAFRKIYLRIINGDIEPCIVRIDDEPLGVFPFKLQHLKDAKYRCFSSFNEALDEYFKEIFISEKVLGGEERARHEAEKLMKRIKQHRKLLEKYSKESTHYKRIAEVLYENLPLIERLLYCLKACREQLGSWDNVLGLIRSKYTDLASYIVSLNPKKAIVTINLNGLSITLDIRLSASRNAGRYYKLYKEANRKAKRIIEVIRKEEEEARSILERKVQKPTLRSRIKREWYERFYWFFTSNNLLVIGGRDAKQNEIIVRRYLRDDYLFFHADFYGAPAVIIMKNNNEPTKKDIIEAAQFAASFSRAWREGLSSVDVYWVYGKQVSKTPPAGEFLPKGAFMVRGKRNYIRGMPLKVRIMLLKFNDSFKLMCAPSVTSREDCISWVELVPGDIEKRKVCEIIRSTLIRNADTKEAEEYIKGLPIEEIERLLPPGSARITASGTKLL